MLLKAHPDNKDSSPSIVPVKKYKTAINSLINSLHADEQNVLHVCIKDNDGENASDAFFFRYSCILKVSKYSIFLFNF